MSKLVIHRVTTFDLAVEAWSWPFSRERNTEIDAYFKEQVRRKPALWNGTVLLARNLVLDRGRLSVSYFETDFASFLSWRDWGYPDKSVFNAFGMGALLSNDGAFVLGEMGPQTANAGRIYFASGMADLNDVRDGTFDMPGCIERELEEETGLLPSDYRSEPVWHCVFTGPALAMIRIVRVDMPGDALRDRLKANLAAQSSPELSDIHLVRHAGELSDRMPVYVTAFIESHLSPQP